MVTVLDIKFLPKIYAAINKYGVSAVFVVQASNVYDPVSGAATITSSNVTVKSTPPAAYDKKYVDGDIIKATDMYVLVAGQGLTFTPITGQLVTIAGVQYTAMIVTPLYSGDSAAAYQIQLRK